jgi:acyl carrier protein
VNHVVEHARAILARELNLEIENLSSHLRLREDLGMDSIVALNLIFAAEREMEIVIKEEDVVRLVTVADLEQLIRKLTSP